MRSCQGQAAQVGQGAGSQGSRCSLQIIGGKVPTRERGKTHFPETRSVRTTFTDLRKLGPD